MDAEMLKGRRILLGVTGGVAAYKSADLCRQFIRAGAEVQVVMTPSATEFVAPLTFETLSSRPVYLDLFSRAAGWEVEHVSHARWAEVLVIAPASANTIAKMAAGMADNALTSTVLASTRPLLLAPAMNWAMWNHPQVQANCEALRRRGVLFVGPDAGSLACGEEGAGRMVEPAAILEAAVRLLREASAARPLAGKRVLITAGPTVEAIDPVRFLSNPSTGRMGYAIAEEARLRGAEVTLVSGPTSLEPPTGMAALRRVRSTREMRDAVLADLAEQDICVFCAAPADYTPAAPSAEKIKKESAGDTMTLDLVRTPDIAAEANAARRPGQIFVGFAAETNEMVVHARDKMRRKGFDVVVANEVSPRNAAFAVEENAATVLTRWGGVTEIPKMSKREMAARLWDLIIREE